MFLCLLSSLSFIEAHFVSLSGTEEFLQLSSTELEQFIRRDTLNVLNEEQVCPPSRSKHSLLVEDQCLKLHINLYNKKSNLTFITAVLYISY